MDGGHVNPAYWFLNRRHRSSFPGTTPIHELVLIQHFGRRFPFSMSNMSTFFFQFGPTIWLSAPSSTLYMRRHTPALVAVVVLAESDSSSTLFSGPPSGTSCPDISSRPSVISRGFAGLHQIISPWMRCSDMFTEWGWVWSRLIGLKLPILDLLSPHPGGLRQTSLSVLYFSSVSHLCLPIFLMLNVDQNFSSGFLTPVLHVGPHYLVSNRHFTNRKSWI